MNASTEKGEKKMYILVNHDTGEIKKFTNYDDMHEWWMHLSIEESFAWSGWTFIVEGDPLARYLY